MQDLILVSEIERVEIALDPTAAVVAQSLLFRAEEITAVTDTLDADLAAGIVKDITRHLAAIEASRKDVKAPVLDLGKRIDAIAKAHIEPLEREKSRIGAAASAFISRQRAEREAAEAEARRAEKARLAALAAEQATALDLETQAANAERAAAEIGAIRAEAKAAAPVPAGAGVRKRQCFRVVDEAALLAACPQVFAPDDAKIRAMLRTLPQEAEVPGLLLWVEETLVVR